MSGLKTYPDEKFEKKKKSAKFNQQNLKYVWIKNICWWEIWKTKQKKNRQNLINKI